MLTLWLSFAKQHRPFTTGMVEEMWQIEGILVASIDAIKMHFLWASYNIKSQ
jgi:hypothetical protein